MHKVTMNLTDADVANAQHLHTTLKLRSKAQVVSMSLSLTRFLADLLVKNPGAQLVLRNENGSQEAIHVAEFAPLRSR